MKPSLRIGTTADEIAELHALLGTAARAIAATYARPEGQRQPLKVAPATELHRMATSLRTAMYRLETPFSHAVGPDAPLANADDPHAWQRWLTERAAS